MGHVGPRAADAFGELSRRIGLSAFKAGAAQVAKEPLIEDDDRRIAAWESDSGDWQKKFTSNEYQHDKEQRYRPHKDGAFEQQAEHP